MTSRAFALFVVSAVLAVPASAEVFSYEIVGIGGPNNVVDSNATSCDSVEGCYTRTGARCSETPNQLCNLQIVPAGRCTYGNLTTGLASCAWPHRAGHCSGNAKVACLTSDQCSSAGGTCLLTTDIFGAPYEPVACTCQGTNAAGLDFEMTICGGALSVCSDGDPLRDVGGFGTVLGVELNTGGSSGAFIAELGPAVTGASKPSSTPVYAIENPPSVFDPQRSAGTSGRPVFQGTGPIRQARTTDARDISPYAHPTIATPVDVRKVTIFGDSHWEDWAFRSATSVGITFNIHTVSYTCDPPLGWDLSMPLPSGAYCHQLGRNGLSFLWGSNLTGPQVAAYTAGGQRICPPNCNKDFDLSTTETQAFYDAGFQDPNAGIQLAIQSGEEAPGRQAGSHDALGVTPLTWILYLGMNDLRCRMGGWGNPPGLVGRCSDGPSACAPGAAGCLGEGDSCRSCGGPFDAATNPLGLPIGYNTHGRTELDLVAGQRIGGIAGVAASVRVPIFLVETTGNATAEFRDKAAEGAPPVDLADMGSVDPSGPPFGPGVGAGGTFANDAALNIGATCCASGAPISWNPAQLGAVVPGFDAFVYRYGSAVGEVYSSDWALTYDKGPGPDGIPGCIGDNANALNGGQACNQRLGVGAVGLKTDGFYATGQDDRAIRYTVGAAPRPASAARFQWADSPAAVKAYFGGAQNPPIVNTVAAFAARDVNYITTRGADLLAKLNTTACPLTNAGAQCALACAGLGGDTDGDGICDNADNCPTVANPLQEDGGDGIANGSLPGSEGSPPFDGVGNACDNCVNVNNPIVPGGATAFLAANPWATLTGGQRDDDHDGYGNICDGDFNNSATTNAADTAQYKAALGQLKAADVCGTTIAFPAVGYGTKPCAIWDINATNSTEASTSGVNAADTARYKLLLGMPPGPRCTACTGTGSAVLPCTAGTAGACF